MVRGVKGSIKVKDLRVIYEAASLESYKLIRSKLSNTKL